MVFLGLACALLGLGISLQVGLNDNFAVNEIGVNGFEKGLVEAIRETCGITALGVLALLAGLAEPIIGAAMLMVFGVALSANYLVEDLGWFIVVSVLWSQGLHVWMPLPSSMAMSLAEPGQTGRRLGQLQAAGAVGGLIGFLLARGLAALGVTIRPMFALAGGAAVLAAAACLMVPRDIKTPGPRFIFRRRYGLYYLLSFLEGWRKQIFLAFAGFLLVKNHDLPLETMLTLWLLSQSALWLVAPLAGRLIDRLGERLVLTLYYLGLIGLFCGYAFVDNVTVLEVLFVTDNVLFSLGLALTTYVRRLAPPEEHTPTLSMGVAMNHVAAVTMPLVGGLIWTGVGYQWTFGLGILAAVLSIAAVSRLPRHECAAT